MPRIGYFTFGVLCIWLAPISPLAVRAQPTSALQKPWINSSATPAARAASLLEAMTLEEKVGQLSQTNGIGGDATGDVKSLVADSQLFELIRTGQLGSILNEINPATINEFQRLAVEESRLGIPLIIGRDVIHGYRTIFPIPLGQAASWNPDAVEQACAIAAKEARSRGVHWTFAPMVDIARDARWGRIAEGFGEDPYLASAFAAASVRGYQGEDLSAEDRILACAKHFVAYGAAEGGRDYNTTQVSNSLMWNMYLPPFRAAVDAGVGTLMCSFNDVNGVPMSAHSHWLREVLRDKWGFKGFVVSDWESIKEMISHGYAADMRHAAILSADAGVNMEMTSDSYRKHLSDAVESSEVSAETIDELVLPVLKSKFQLGLFENPYVDVQRQSILLTEAHLEHARKVARESTVLLKNKDNTLPLDRKKLKKLALIGPLADSKHDQLGCWIPDGKADDSRTPLEAIRDSAQSVEILYVQALENAVDRSTAQFAEAVATAERCDAVVLFVGEGANLSGEARSRAILDLPGSQSELVAQIAALGKPTVLLVQAGRPLTIAKECEQVDAVLYSFHAGTMAGPALADLLWGVAAPSGKLPVTFPKSVGQEPLYYNHTMTGRPPREYDFAKDHLWNDEPSFDLGYNSNYLDVSPYPFYPFGYGLSYTTFEYGEVELSTKELRKDQILSIRAPVTNTGKVSGTEVVQLYVRDVVGSITRPVRELKGFRRVELAPGETEIVEFALPMNELAFYNNEEERLSEPGKFEVFVGGNSLAPQAGEFELVE